MSLDHWLAFVAASAVLLAVPGPTVLVVISYALGHGAKPAAAIIAGVALGDLTAMTASMLGLGAVLATSALVFTGLRWLGGAYLIYLGLKLWRAPVGEAVPGAVPAAVPSRMFTHAYAVTALNPKSIIFFVAFVPQFLDGSRAFLPQVVILVSSFVIMATLNSLGFAFLASMARQRLKQPRIQRVVNRTGGSMLIGAGMFALGWRRATG